MIFRFPFVKFLIVLARQKLTRRGERRRDDLVRHAIGVIARQGITRTRVLDVTRAARVPSSLFYWYFDDLDDLVRFAITDASARLRRRLAAAIEGLDDPLECLYVALREAFRIGARDSQTRVLTAADAELQLGGHYRAELDRSIDVFLQDTLRLLAEGQRRGTVRQDVPALHLAYCLRSLVHYNLTARHRGRLRGDVGELASTIADVGLRGICADPVAAGRIAARIESRRQAGTPREPRARRPLVA